MSVSDSLESPRTLSIRIRAAIAVAAVVVFVWLAGRGATGPGLYYDEAHQAAGAFAYVGEPTKFFAQAHVGGLPLLNMPYSGAIKTGIYGLWLKASGEGFDLLHWRALGIALSALGVGVVVLLATAGMTPRGAGLFAGLVVSDGGLILCSRHDWGPVALAFLLRATFVGLWFGDAAAEARGAAATTRRTFWMAALVGFSLYEKLSNLALLGPFAIAMFATPRRRGSKHLRAALFGGLLGAAPLLVVNVHALIEHGDLVSARDARTQERTFAAAGKGLLSTAAVGSGAEAAARIFASPKDGAPRAAIEAGRVFELAKRVEIAGVFVVLLCAFASSKRNGRFALASPAVRAACSWTAVAATLELLPGHVDVHHRIVATPFSALACACAFSEASGRALFARCSAGFWIVGRVLGVVTIVLASVPGGDPDERDATYAPLWRPSLDSACRAVAELPADVLVLAPDWGVAVPVYCYANGSPDRVRELRRNYGGVEELRRVLDARAYHACVLLAPNAPTGVAPPERFDEVVADLRALGWIERGRPPFAPDAARFKRFERP